MMVTRYGLFSQAARRLGLFPKLPRRSAGLPVPLFKYSTSMLLSRFLRYCRSPLVAGQQAAGGNEASEARPFLQCLCFVSTRALVAVARASSILHLRTGTYKPTKKVRNPPLRSCPLPGAHGKKWPKYGAIITAALHIRVSDNAGAILYPTSIDMIQ